MPPIIECVSQLPKVGEEIVFSSKGKAVENLIWDFGDNDTTGSTIGKHTYHRAGKFIVTASAEGGCESEPLEVVVEKVKVHREVKPIVVFPEVHAGESITVSDNTEEAESWSWFLNGKLVSEKRDWTNIFANSGTYSVKLVVDGKWVSGDSTYKVKVLPKPVETKTRGGETKEVIIVDEKKGRPDDTPFIQKFIEISNELLSKATAKDASDRWKNEIMNQGCGSDFKVSVYGQDGKFIEELALDLFKRNLLYDQYKSIKYVAKDKIIRSAKDEFCILKIDVTVEK